ARSTITPAPTVTSHPVGPLKKPRDRCGTRMPPSANTARPAPSSPSDQASTGRRRSNSASPTRSSPSSTSARRNQCSTSQGYNAKASGGKEIFMDDPARRRLPKNSTTDYTDDTDENEARSASEDGIRAGSVAAAGSSLALRALLSVISVSSVVPFF